MSYGNAGSGATDGHLNTAIMAVQAQENNTTPRRRTVRDYQFGTAIGEGLYSTVYLAVDLYNNKTYAVKMLSKKHIVQEGKIKYVNIEKTTLHRLGVQHPGIVQLYYTFQDELSLFFVLDFAEYGELLSIISKFGSLLESVLKFYMLQILDAVKFIHLKGVIHRDLKPENILVGYDFNLKITDFGAAKLLGEDEDRLDEKITYDSINDSPQNSRQERRGSFVGTAEYVPPELLKYNLCGFETDIWAIACILFQFFNGVPPFKGATEYLTFEKIIKVEYAYKENLPPMVKEIIEKILVFEPLKRPTIPEIQAMSWFRNVPWNNRDYIWNRKVPRFEPYTKVTTPISNPPHIKTGANRHYNKSNSNYQLHSQILKFDNLVPSLSSKPLYLPATRLNKGISAQLSSPQNAPTTMHHSSKAPPPMRQEVDQSSHDRQFNAPPSPVRGQFRQKPNQAAFRQMAMETHHSGHHMSQTTTKKSPPEHARSAPQSATQESTPPKSNSYIAAQQASASLSPLEKTLEETKITTSNSAPEYKSLRTNTAFASFPKQSSPRNTALETPLNSKPVPNTSQVSVQSLTVNASVPDLKPLRTAKKEPVLITIKEISSFLDPDEKIIKLDCVLKLTLSNKLVNRKAGSLDDELIEELVERHQMILDESMTPVIACISNKAKVFLIDENLDVMRVDLTANKGGDYLMYDYEFESVIVDDDNLGAEKSEEVFGYLILELIKEGGDLIFLKRLNDQEKGHYSHSIRVVGSNGGLMRIGSNFGWIDCLIWAKEIVDKDLRGQKSLELSNKTIPPQRQNFETKNQISSSKPSRSMPEAQKAGSRSSSSSTAKANSKPKSNALGEEKRPLDSKAALNKFAYAAAAAAAHR